MGAGNVKAAHVYVDRYLIQQRRYKAAVLLHHLALVSLDNDREDEPAGWFFGSFAHLAALFSRSPNPSVRHDELRRELTYLASLGVVTNARHPTRRRGGYRLRAWRLELDQWPHLGLPVLDLHDPDEPDEPDAPDAPETVANPRLPP